MTPTIEPLGRVVGRNVRRLRHEREMSLEDVALVARGYGFGWSASRVNALQRGARDPKLSTLLALARVFECSLFDLCKTDADVIDLGDVSVKAADFLLWLMQMNIAGSAVPLAYPSNPPDRAEWVAERGWGSEDQMVAEIGLSTELLHPMAMRCGLTETRTAKAMNIDADVLNAITWHLFDGRTFGEERDRIADEEHRSAGDVTTELREQIREHVNGWPDSRLNPTHYPPEDPR